jgi:hypothetical protein
MALLFNQKPTFNADIGKWNVARVTTLYQTFNNATVFNRDIGKWNVASVTTLYQTFFDAAAFNRDIGKWNTARVASMPSNIHPGSGLQPRHRRVERCVGDDTAEHIL